MVVRLLSFLFLLVLSEEAPLRVRREIRTLSKGERKQFFDALWTIKRTPGDDGRKIYGDGFMNMDEMVLKHGHASLDPRCDQGHFGPAFVVYHRLYTLLFEKVLLLVAPELKAAPYWNMDIDVAEYDSPDDSIIWSNEWFGSAHPRPEDGYMVKDGYFAGWPISKSKDVPGADFENGYGYLRTPWNPLNTPNLTRIPLMCESPHFLNGSQARTTECHSKDDFMGWYDCIDNLMSGEHGQAHLWLGGLVSRDRTPKKFAECTQGWGGNPASDTGMLYDYVTGCVQCPTNCTSPDIQSCLCTWSDNGQCANAGFNEAYAGDFLCPVTSPNDPIFLIHHTNIDRQFMEWQLKYASQFGGMQNYAGYFTFPESGKCEGHNLDDVISSRDPFYGLIPGVIGPYTIKDVLNYTRLGVNSFWTYDTLV